MLQFDIADGIATSQRGLALQTDKLNVLGGGAIKLETEEIELRFKTVKRTGVGLSLLGVAAWATGGLSLVADQIIQRLTAFGSPCEKVLRRDGSDPQP